MCQMCARCVSDVCQIQTGRETAEEAAQASEAPPAEASVCRDGRAQEQESGRLRSRAETSARVAAESVNMHIHGIPPEIGLRHYSNTLIHTQIHFLTVTLFRYNVSHAARARTRASHSRAWAACVAVGPVSIRTDSKPAPAAIEPALTATSGRCCCSMRDHSSQGDGTQWAAAPRHKCQPQTHDCRTVVV